MLPKLLRGQGQRRVPKISFLRRGEIAQLKVFGFIPCDRERENRRKQILCARGTARSVAVSKEGRGACHWRVPGASCRWSCFSAKENYIWCYKICLRWSSIWRKSLHRRPATVRFQSCNQQNIIWWIYLLYFESKMATIAAETQRSNAAVNTCSNCFKWYIWIKFMRDQVAKPPHKPSQELALLTRAIVFSTFRRCQS